MGKTNVSKNEYLRQADYLVSEKAFQKQVEMTFREQGWSVFHTLRSKGSTPGYPDIVAIHNETGVQVVIELKVGDGKCTKAQIEWLNLYRKSRVPAFVFWPRHWKQIVAVADGMGYYGPREGVYTKDEPKGEI